MRIEAKAVRDASGTYLIRALVDGAEKPEYDCTTKDASEVDYLKGVLPIVVKEQMREQGINVENAVIV